MADKELNEVPKVTDMEYVPVIMADGNIGQIAKADLASVVAGLIGEATTSKAGLMPTRYINSTVFTESGKAITINFDDYAGSTPALVCGSNSPNGNSGRWHVLVQWIGASTCIQIALDYETNVAYIRTRTPIFGWGTWKSLS